MGRSSIFLVGPKVQEVVWITSIGLFNVGFLDLLVLLALDCMSAKILNGIYLVVP
jgi:hypothetical protein